MAHAKKSVHWLPRLLFRPSVMILDNPGQIVPTGLNTALLRAEGEIIVRVDGHTIIAPDYVRQCVASLQRIKADNVGGRMNAVGETPFGKTVALASSTPFGIGGWRFHYSAKEEWVDTVYMGAWPRRIFEKIGLFDEELVRDQDDEFNYRWAKEASILLSPAIRSKIFRTEYARCFVASILPIRLLEGSRPPKASSPDEPPPVCPASLCALLIVSVLFVFPISFPSFPLHPSLYIPLLYILVNLAASIYTCL